MKIAVPIGQKISCDQKKRLKDLAQSMQKRPMRCKRPRKPKAKKELVGIDVFLQATDTNAEAIAKSVQQYTNGTLHLSMITNRGTKVWPNGFPETFCTDHWRCRFKATDNNILNFSHAIELQLKLHNANLDIIKTENLYNFDGEAGFTAAQGQ